MFCCYNSKDGRFISYSGEKLVPMIPLIFFDLPKFIVCVKLTIYLQYFPPFFKHMIQYQLWLLRFNTIVAPVVCDNGQSSFVFLVVSLQ